MRTSMRDRPLARAMDVRLTDDTLIVAFEDGRVLHVPLEWFPRLRSATPEQRANFRLIGRGVGIHWPELDEDLSVQGLLSGSPTGEVTEPKRPVEPLLGDDGDNESPPNGSRVGRYRRIPVEVR